MYKKYVKLGKEAVEIEDHETLEELYNDLYNGGQDNNEYQINIEYIFLQPYIDYNNNWNGGLNNSKINNSHSLGMQISFRNKIFYRYNFEFGLNIYKQSINSTIDFNPYLQFNI